MGANPEGSYRVSVLGGRGAGAPIDAVRPLIPGATFAVNERVVLLWQRPGEAAVILTAGGGGGTIPWDVVVE